MCHAASILAGVAAASGLDAAISPSRLSAPPSTKCNEAQCIRSRTIHLEQEQRISLAHAEPSKETRPPPSPPNPSSNRGEHSLHAVHHIPHAHPAPPLPPPPPKIPLSKIPNQHPSKLSNVEQTMDRPSSFEDPPYTHPPPYRNPRPAHSQPCAATTAPTPHRLPLLKCLAFSAKFLSSNSRGMPNLKKILTAK